MSDPEHVLYDLLPQQIQRVRLRNDDHKLMFPKVSTGRFKNSFINQCNLMGYFFRKKGGGFALVPYQSYQSYLCT